MYPAIRDALRGALDPDPRPVLPPGDRLAAVLAPLVVLPEPTLIFTVRAPDLSRHAGEVSFPGGLLEEGEALVEAALRETFEEIGIDPSDVEVLGALPPVNTSVSGILVVPFVGMLERPSAFTVSDAEITKVLSFPVAALAEVEREVEYPREGGGVWRGWDYELEGEVVWGATGWMLHSLMEIVRKEAPWLLREP
jgi:8-oxo-dGTP pyrophosphatase MutT (NUDIX family)